GLLMIAPYLGGPRHAEVIERARFRAKKEIARLIAEIDPKPEVPARIEPVAPAAPRRMPMHAIAKAFVGPVRSLPEGDRPADWIEPPRRAEAGTAGEIAVAEQARELAEAEAALDRAWLARREARPGRPLRFKIQFTAEQEYVDLIEEAFDLLGLGKRAASLPDLQLRALREFVERLRQRKTGTKLPAREAARDTVTSRPPAGPVRKTGTSQAHAAPAREPVTSRPHAAPARETVTSRAPAAPARETVTSRPPAALARKAVTSRPPAALAREAVTSQAPAAPARETLTSRAPAALARETLTSRALAALAREAVTSSPPAAPARETVTSRPLAALARRHVSAAIRREVWTRDAGRCAYTDDRGRRCPETGSLDLHHREAH